MSGKNEAAVKVPKKPEEIRERSAMIRSIVCRMLCIAVFVCALIVTWSTAWQVSSHLLDSDTSSEMVLAEKLAREGGIVSSSWIYSTELEVLNIQIVYSLLFHLTNDWSMVRFLGIIVLHCLMLGAYGYMARQTRMRMNAFLLTAAAMILPYSVPYGRIVLYHTYYIAYVIVAMWLVGLYFSSMRKIHDWRDRKRAGEKIETKSTLLMILPAALLMIISFVSGLGGMRMLMISAAPLVLAACLWAMTGENGSDEPRPFRLPLALAVGAAAFCAAGYFVNTHVLANIYKFADFSEQVVTLASVSRVETILRGLLAAVGFQETLSLFTVHGLLSIGAAVMLLMGAILSLHVIRHTKDPYARFVQIYMLMGLLVVTCVFVLLDSLAWEHTLYYLPLIFWIVPALGKTEIECPPENYRPKVRPAETEEKKVVKHGKLPAILFPGSTGAPTRMGRLLGLGDRPLTAHGLMALLCCCVLIGNGFFYAGFFKDPASMGTEVVYSGLRYTDPFTVEGLQPLADYLKNEGYTLCYAEYWQASVLTELTDGQVKNVPIKVGGRRKAVEYENWLVDSNLWKPENLTQEKACIIAGVEMITSLEGEDKIMKNAAARESFGEYTVYELTDPTTIAVYLD